MSCFAKKNLFPLCLLVKLKSYFYFNTYILIDCFVGSIALDGIDVQVELNEQFHQQLIDRRNMYWKHHLQVATTTALSGSTESSKQQQQQQSLLPPPPPWEAS